MKSVVVDSYEYERKFSLFKHNLCYSWVEKVTGVSFICMARCYLFTISILVEVPWGFCPIDRVQLEWDGKCTETKFHLAVKWKGPHKSVGVKVQLTSGSRGVQRTFQPMFCTRVTLNDYPLSSHVSPSLPPHTHTHHCMPCHTNQALHRYPPSEVNQMECQAHNNQHTFLEWCTDTSVIIP
jgi:hypothetical protein